MIRNAGINNRKKTVWITVQGSGQKLEIPFSRLEKKPVRKVKIHVSKVLSTEVVIQNTVGDSFRLSLANFTNYKALNRGSNKIKLQNKLISYIKKAMVEKKVGVRELATLHNTSPSRIIEALDRKRSPFKLDRLMDIAESLGVKINVTYSRDNFQKY